MGSFIIAGNRQKNVRWRLAVLLVLATAGLGLTWPTAGASPLLSGFTATASAQGGRADFTVPGFAVVETIADAGGPVSQSAVDSSTALSFASMPYPGDLVISGPGLFAGLTGIEPPGSYPFYVSASNPTTPQQSFQDPTGAYQLLAKASSGSASSVAKARGQAGQGASGGSSGAQAITSAVVQGDTVTVTAQTINEALDFGDGALRIASVRSKSVTTYTAGQPQPVTKTELAIDGGSAGGTSFGVGPDGLVVAGQGVPIPLGSAVDQLNAALKPAGISLRFGGAQKLAGGASADALEISLAGRAPVPGTPPGVITVRLGGATSAVTRGDGTGGLIPPAAGSVGGGDETNVPPAVPPPTAGAGTMSPGAALADNDGPSPANESFSPGRRSSGSASRLASAPITEATPSVAAPAASATVRPPVATGLAEPILHPRKLGSDGILYWVIIGAGMLMLAVPSLWRAKGVLTL